jgi:hypothetical protein
MTQGVAGVARIYPELHQPHCHSKHQIHHRFCSWKFNIFKQAALCVLSTRSAHKIPKCTTKHVNKTKQNGNQRKTLARYANKRRNPLTAQEASRKRKKKNEKKKGTDNNAQLISGKIKLKTQIPTTKI